MTRIRRKIVIVYTRYLMYIIIWVWGDGRRRGTENIGYKILSWHHDDIILLLLISSLCAGIHNNIRNIPMMYGSRYSRLSVGNTYKTLNTAVNRYIRVGSRVLGLNRRYYTSWVQDIVRYYTSWVRDFFRYYTSSWIFFGKYSIILTFSFPF